MKILLVDDDQAVLDMMTRLLVHRGHEVQACASPFAVPAAVVRNLPELVILDVMMPGLDGTSLAGALRQLQLARPPRLVLWSAMDDQALADAARAAGGLATISKAMRATEIAAAIERLGPGEPR